VALAWDTVWDITTGQRVVNTWRTVIVRVERNHVYESPALLSDPHYQRFAALTKRLVNNNNNNNNNSEVHNSLDVVRWWMVQANYAAGDTLRRSAVPALFRSAPAARPLPAAAAAVLPPWWNTSAGVLSTSPPSGSGSGSGSGSDSVYAPVTSPLRRIVDLVNSALLMDPDTDTDNTRQWTEPTTLARLHTTLRNIRRVESDAALWHLCRRRVAQGHTDLDGYILACEKEEETDKHKHKHLLITLYLPDLKHVTSVRLPHPHDDSLTLPLPLSPTPTRWRLFLFDDAVRLRQKLRLTLLLSPN
jgi:hypothetical protein